MILIKNLALYSVVTALLVYLFLYRLDVSPTPWIDEGAYLNVARTYAQHGVYAEYSSEGYRFTGPVISVGPTVLLPVALIFRVFGVSVLGARLVIVAYGVLMLITLYGLCLTLQNHRLSLLALVLAVVATADRSPYMFRNVTGEAPGLFFLFAALWLWLRPVKSRLSTLIIVGLLFGLASITKSQFAIFILPSLLLVWIFDLVWYRQHPWWHFVVPGVIAGVIFFSWTYYVLFLLGTDVRNVTSDLISLRAASTISFFVLQIEVIAGNLYFLSNGAVFGGLLFPAVLFGIFISRERNYEGQRWSIVTTFLNISLLIYIFSIGWSRFAIPTLFLSTPLVALLFYRLSNCLQIDWRTLRENANNENRTRVLLTVLALGLLPGLLILPTLRAINYPRTIGSDAPYRVAAYLDAEIPASALIETWDKELSVLTDHRYHFPIQITEAALARQVHLDGEAVSELYDFRDYVDPDYVIIGPYSEEAAVYTEERLTDYVLILNIDNYHIYGRRG